MFEIKMFHSRGDTRFLKQISPNLLRHLCFQKENKSVDNIISVYFYMLSILKFGYSDSDTKYCVYLNYKGLFTYM